MHVSSSMARTTGVFVGASNQFCPMSANRISYTLGLQGPSILVDTACSSALVAVDLGIAMMSRGHCAFSIAVATACPVASLGRDARHRHMLSPSGRCRTFDASAEGYVLGEGCGALLVQPASVEIVEHTVHTAVNQDGRSSTMTAANCRAQISLLSAALLSAGMSPEQLTFVECHGTGTPLGDPVEVVSIASVLRACAKSQPVVLGAVKTNIGHIGHAAGLPGIIKCILLL